MLSPASKKPVLIDFGFARLVREELGKKTRTLFCGTVNFSSQEMIACLVRKQ